MTPHPIGCVRPDECGLEKHLKECLACQLEARILAEIRQNPLHVREETRRRHHRLLKEALRASTETPG